MGFLLHILACRLPPHLSHITINLRKDTIGPCLDVLVIYEIVDCLSDWYCMIKGFTTLLELVTDMTKRLTKMAGVLDCQMSHAQLSIKEGGKNQAVAAITQVTISIPPIIRCSKIAEVI